MITFKNVHVESCGTPPAWVSEETEDYRGYFENEHGEQFVIRIARESDEYYARLAGGDLGWAKTREARGENAQELYSRLIITAPGFWGVEAKWVAVCITTATTFPLKTDP